MIATSDPRTVLVLSSERIDKKLPFEQFKDKIVNYVGRVFENGDDVVCILKSRTNPKPAFDKKHLPKELSEEDKKVTSRSRFSLKE